MAFQTIIDDEIQSPARGYLSAIPDRLDLTKIVLRPGLSQDEMWDTVLCLLEIFGKEATNWNYITQVILGSDLSKPVYCYYRADRLSAGSEVPL
jgi:hypothetical protein